VRGNKDCRDAVRSTGKPVEIPSDSYGVEIDGWANELLLSQAQYEKKDFLA
jgi:hypothetical protein